MYIVSFENSWISSVARTKQSKGQTENWLRGLVNLIEIVRNEFIFYCISLHTPWAGDASLIQELFICLE